MKRATQWGLFAVVLLIAGCDAFLPGTGSESVEGDVLFQASFEYEADTAGWQANGVLRLEDDAPVGGGQRSARVAGGCVWPHSARTFVADAGGRLEMRAWGRNLAIGGGLTLRNQRTGGRASIGVRDSTWTYLRSDTTLAVRVGDTLQVWMGAGGFVASAMLVDQIEVRWAE